MKRRVTGFDELFTFGSEESIANASQKQRVFRTPCGKPVSQDFVFLRLVVTHPLAVVAKVAERRTDGERKLWDLQETWLGRAVQVLDFFHVLKRVREVSKVVHADDASRRDVWVSVGLGVPSDSVERLYTASGVALSRQLRTSLCHPFAHS